MLTYRRKVAFELQMRFLGMRRLRTRHFGVVDLEDSAEIQFPHGLPGFEEETSFVFLERGELRPLVFLQSTANEHVCLPCLPASVVEPGYKPSLSEDDAAVLESRGGDECSEELLCLVVVSPSAEGYVAANLLSPIVVNPRARVGLQAVRHDGEYSVRWPLPQPEEAAC